MEIKEGNCLSKRRLVVGVGLAIFLLVTTAAVIGLVLGLKKDNATEIAEVPEFLSVHSFGTSNNITRFDVKYRAGTDCQTEIHFVELGSRDRGRRVLHPQTDVYGISTVHIQVNLSLIQSYLLHYVHCPRTYGSIYINLSALNTIGSQVLVNQNDKLPFNIVNSGLNDATGEYIVTLDMANNKTIAYFFNGLNTSAENPVVFEYSEHDDSNWTGRFRTSFHEKVNDKREYTIHVENELVRNGGIFTIGGVTNVKTKYVRSISVGTHLLIHSPVTGDVVPIGKSGFYPSYSGNTNRIIGDTSSMTCFTMGNPLPRLEAYVRTLDNETVRMKSSYVHYDEYSLAAVVTVTKDAFPGGGIFGCRTIPGDKHYEAEFKFVEIESSVIDKNMSGVIAQSPEMDVIRCTSTGSPLPNIYFHLYWPSGPYLGLTRLFQSTEYINGTVKSVTLTISPPNLDIHTVYCESVQEDAPGTNRTYYRIGLHPARRRNETLVDLLWKAIRDNADN